jgi:hypothetical protein
MAWWTEIKTAYNSTYKNLAVRWLNGALCFVLSFVVADSFVLRNRQLLVAANRYVAFHTSKFPIKFACERQKLIIP